MTGKSIVDYVTNYIQCKAHETFIRFLAFKQRSQGRHVVISSMSMSELELALYELELTNSQRDVSILFAGVGDTDKKVADVITYTQGHGERSVFNSYSKIAGGISVSSRSPFTRVRIVLDGVTEIQGRNLEKENSNA